MYLIGYRILLAFLIGAAIGLEREVNEKSGVYGKKPSAVLGIRTFSLVSVLGAIVGVFSLSLMPLALLIGLIFFSLLSIFYVLDVKATNDRGITTEVGLLYSFIIGLLLTTDVLPVQITLAISVCVLLLLSQKDFIKSTVQKIRTSELNAFISFGIIALSILPFLPNQSYSALDIPGLKDLFQNAGIIQTKLLTTDLINPFKIWLYVALITGVDLVGYIFEKTLGKKKGWLLASAAGGFVSSTATTQSLAKQSVAQKRVNHLVAAALVANVVSFIQVAMLLIPINIAFVFKLIPVFILMIVVAVAALLYFLHFPEKKITRERQQLKKEVKIIDLRAALTFAGLFIIVSIISQVALVLFGNNGFLVTSALGAIVGLDAVMINTAQLVGKNIDVTTATIAFIIANAVNLGAKTFYSYTLGAKLFTLKFGLSMAAIILASILGFFITSLL